MLMEKEYPLKKEQDFSALIAYAPCAVHVIVISINTQQRALHVFKGRT